MNIQATTDGTNPTEVKINDEEIVKKFAGKNELELREMIYKDPSITPQLERLAVLIETNQTQISGGQTDSGVTTETPATTKVEEGITVEKEVSVQINPEILGDYAKGRTLSEAIREVVKGKSEADKTITFFKDHKVPLLEKTVANLQQSYSSLKKELEEWKAKSQQQKNEPSTGSSTDETIPELPEEIDYFDPDHQELVGKSLKSMAKTIRDLKSAVESGKIAQPQATQEREPQASATSTSSEIDEFAQIRMLQANPQFNSLLATKTDIADLNNQYIKFLGDLASVAGVNAFDANGNVTPEMTNVLVAYDNPANPNHQQVVQRATQLNVKPPEEINTLRNIYQIRAMRNKYTVRDGSGNAIPIDYEEAGRLFVASNVALTQQPAPTPKVDELAKEHEARQRAIENRNQYSIEPKTTDGADPASANAAEMNDFDRLLKKPRDQYSEAERLTLRGYLRKYAEMPDQEIDSWFRVQR